MADRVRWGVLGAAGIAKIALIPAMHAARNACLAILASRDLAQAARDLAGLDVPRIVPGYEALIDDPAVADASHAIPSRDDRARIGRSHHEPQARSLLEDGDSFSTGEKERSRFDHDTAVPAPSPSHLCR